MNNLQNYPLRSSLFIQHISNFRIKGLLHTDGNEKSAQAFLYLISSCCRPILRTFCSRTQQNYSQTNVYAAIGGGLFLWELHKLLLCFLPRGKIIWPASQRENHRNTSKHKKFALKFLSHENANLEAMFRNTSQL